MTLLAGVGGRARPALRPGRRGGRHAGAEPRRGEIEGLIGFFVNTLALRVDLSGAPSVAELLGRVQERRAGAQRHQDIPFEQVVERLQPVRSLAHTPLFQVMFAWQNAPRERLELPGLDAAGALDPELSAQVSAKFDLALSLWEDGGADRGVRGRTPPRCSTGRRWSAGWATCGGCWRDGGGRAAERWSGWSCSPRPSGAGWWWSGTPRTRRTRATRASTSCSQAQAARTPDAVARRRARTRRSRTRELNARANRLAHHLRALGVGPEARVGDLPGARAGAGRRRSWPCSRPAARTCRWTPPIPRSGWRYMLDDAARAVLLTRRGARRSGSRGRRAGSSAWTPTRERIAARARTRPPSGVTPGPPGVRHLHLREHRPAQGRDGGAPRVRQPASRWRGALRHRRAATASCSSPRSRFDAAVCGGVRRAAGRRPRWCMVPREGAPIQLRRCSMRCGAARITLVHPAAVAGGGAAAGAAVPERRCGRAARAATRLRRAARGARADAVRAA